MNPSEIKYLTQPLLLSNLVTEKNIINKKIKPIDSETSKADLSTTNSKLLPNRNSLPDILFFNKMKLIISEHVRLIIRKYETGFVSLFIVLVKLNKSTAIKKDAIIGRPGINQARFKNIVLKQAFFYMKL